MTIKNNQTKESFLQKKKDLFLLGLWFANLYLFTKTFGDYIGSQFGTIIAILGTLSVYILKDWIYYYMKKYGVNKVFSIIILLTFIHLIITMYLVKPLKSKATNHETIT